MAFRIILFFCFFPQALYSLFLCLTLHNHHNQARYIGKQSKLWYRYSIAITSCNQHLLHSDKLKTKNNCFASLKGRCVVTGKNELLTDSPPTPHTQNPACIEKVRYKQGSASFSPTCPPPKMNLVITGGTLCFTFLLPSQSPAVIHIVWKADSCHVSFEPTLLSAVPWYIFV